jgi:hypothetical protein
VQVDQGEGEEREMLFAADHRGVGSGVTDV